MKCEKCGQKEATTYYKETLNGQTRVLHLCKDCVREMHLDSMFIPSFGSSLLGDPFDAMMGHGFSFLRDSTPQTQTVCPHCGTDAQTLAKTGRVGCAQCYHTFADRLLPYIRKIHGTDHHIGDAPSEPQTKPTETSPLDALQAQLQEALKQERYEDAARLRDEIKQMQEGQA